MKQWLESSSILRTAYYGAVTRRDVVDPVRHLLAARAGHVFDDHAGLAGNMGSKILTDNSRIDVVAAAGRRTDGELYRFSYIKIRYRIGGPYPVRTESTEAHYRPKNASESNYRRHASLL